MRRFLGALVGLLVAIPALSATTTAPVRVPVVTSSPLLYRVELSRGDATSAARFIDDTKALSWYAQNRPAELGQMLLTAHQALDFRATAAYAADPLQLRRALLARGDSTMFSQPGQVMAVVNSDPELAASAPAFAAASLEWDSLKEGQRSALGRKGVDSARWSAATLNQRVGALRQIYEAMWTARTQGLAPGTPQYLALLDSYLDAAGQFLTSTKEAEMREHREKVAQYQRRLDAARARVDAVADPRLAEALEQIVQTPDVDRATKALDLLFVGVDRAEESESAAPTEPRPFAEPASRTEGLTPRTLALTADAVAAAVTRITQGTEAGAMLEALNAGSAKTKVVIAKSAAGSDAHYDQITDTIVLNERHLAAYLRWEGLTIEQFLGSPGAIMKFSMLITPVYVHEATHRRQALASDRKGITRTVRTYLYSQSDEEESFMAQGLIARRILIQRPKVREWLRAVAKAGPELNGMTHHWSMAYATPEGIAGHVRAHYQATAGEHTARARAVAYARMDAEKLLPYRADAVAELARRKRAPAVERAALGRMDSPEDATAPSHLQPTRVLREIVRITDPTSHEGLIRYYGYLDGLKRSRADLAARLTPPANP